MSGRRWSRRPLPERTYFAARGQPHPRHAGDDVTPAGELPVPLDPDQPGHSDDLRYAVDLFHGGFYWEAHEVLEGLWVAAGREGPTADLLKALIKLCAAGVKVRQGVPEGVLSHARRAHHAFSALAREEPSPFVGFALPELVAFAARVAERAGRWPRPKGHEAAPVFDRSLPVVFAPVDDESPGEPR